MSKGKRSFVLCAKLRRTETPGADADEVMAGQLAIRRLNRIEWVALAYDGRLALRTDDLLLIAFNTAKAAVLSACEMQRRCASLPQVPGSKLALRIGIHKASPPTVPPTQFTQPRPTERRDRKRRFGFEVARLLTDHAPDNGVAVSSLVAATLDPVLLEESRRERGKATDLRAHILQWENVLMRPPVQSPQAVRSAAFTLILAHGCQQHELGRMGPVTTFGRDPACDVVLTDPFASRLHAQIEVGREGCVLTDLSVNGTCIQLLDGNELLIRDGSFCLPERGRIAFGHSVRKLPDAVYEFAVVSR